MPTALLRTAPHPVLVWSLLAVSIVGISFSAPLTAVMAMPVLAIAFWRNLIGAAASAGYLTAQLAHGRLAHGRGAPVAGAGRHAVRSVLRFSLPAGLLLAVHFVSWFSSLRMTSVTAATALVCTTPVWIVAFDRLRGVPVPRRVLLGVSTAFVGVLSITGFDATVSARALAGDLLATLGAIAAAGYVLLGERALRAASTAVHTTLTFGACAGLLLPCALLSGTPLTGFDAGAWWQLAAVTVGAQLLGHTLLNALLPVLGGTPVALAILLEVPGATVIGWLLFRTTPPPATLPATLLILTGLAVATTARSSDPVEGAEQRAVVG